MKELLNRDDIVRYLLEVAEELPDAAREEVVIVGGSMLACRDLRDATRDVDSARSMSQQLLGAASRVAARHDLAPGWLNSHAAGFVPNGDVDIVDPDPVLTTETLVVFTATADAVFLMKLFADRPQDRADLVALWPLCTFDSAHAAADACNEAYEFMRRPDEHLADYVAGIIDEAQR